MKNEQIENNYNLFNSFLDKELELIYTEKKHAKATIKRMAKDFEESKKNEAIISRINDFFFDFIEGCKLARIKYKNEKIINNMDEIEKCDKELEHLIYNREDFKFHILLEQKITNTTFIIGSGGVNIPILEYSTYLMIEYSPNKLCSKKHFQEDFTNYEQAFNYYKELKNKFQNKTSRAIFDYLTNEIDNHCKILNQRIEHYNCN